MKTIGRILACALLAAAFAKNVLATSAANVEFSKERSNIIERSDNTRLEFVPESNPDIGDPQDILDGTLDSDVNGDIRPEESRTFGVKRIQFMLMPMIYKMGVMMTMLTVLTVISVKGLFIGIVLLILKLSTFLSKFHHYHQPAVPQSWSPQQPIHVHVHNSFPYAHPHAHNHWMSASGPESEYPDHYYYKG